MCNANARGRALMQMQCSRARSARATRASRSSFLGAPCVRGFCLSCFRKRASPPGWKPFCGSSACRVLGGGSRVPVCYCAVSDCSFQSPATRLGSEAGSGRGSTLLSVVQSPCPLGWGLAPPPTARIPHQRHLLSVCAFSGQQVALCSGTAPLPPLAVQCRRRAQFLLWLRLERPAPPLPFGTLRSWPAPRPPSPPAPSPCFAGEGVLQWRSTACEN